MAALAGFAAGFALIPVRGTAATITPTPTGQPSPTEAAAPAVVHSPTAAANQVPSEQTEPSPDSNPSPQPTATTKPTATTAPSPTPTPTEGPTLTPTPAFSPSDLKQVSAEQLAEDLVVFFKKGTASALDNPSMAGAPGIGTAGVFDPNLDGQKRTFSAQGRKIVDDQTGSACSIFGKAESGPLLGAGPVFKV